MNASYQMRKYNEEGVWEEKKWLHAKWVMGCSSDLVSVGVGTIMDQRPKGIGAAVGDRTSLLFWVSFGCFSSKRFILPIMDISTLSCFYYFTI